MTVGLASIVHRHGITFGHMAHMQQSESVNPEYFIAST